MATLKEITHDTSTTLSDFYNSITDSDGAFTVTPLAALNGTVNGVQMDFDAGTATAFVRENNYHTVQLSEFYWRFRIDLGGVTNSNAGVEIFAANMLRFSSSGFVEFVINANGGDSGFTADFGYFKDGVGTTTIASAAFPSSGDTVIEARVVRESADGNADGVVNFYVDGVLKASETNAENFNAFQPNYGVLFNFRSSDANVTGTMKLDEILITDDAGLGGLSLASMTKPASINADGTFIYLALLDGGTPILTKIATDLLSDGTTVFNPGAGDNIGVECGRFNSDVIWVAGQFDGTNVVEKSEDGGSNFAVKDDATIGGVRSFIMGPDSDNRILLFDEDNGDILETRDGGESWTTVNPAVTPEINAIARLGQNVEESVFGNDGGGSDSVSYSVNSGDDLEDYQTGVYPATNATKVIVN